ncbi:dTMP kinase [Paeniglutamicibacter sp. R2-26]|uniref:dTMP kinase n=1 Tax=Paeniglutamicibacter sp. R2-26 TaxID=3144417 RepID=UPI003EE495FD
MSSTQQNPRSAGRFIVFEGGDGAGKSTQAALLSEELRKNGHTVLQTREPGGTQIGEKLRSLVLDHGQGTVDARTEALMYAAARAAHVEQVIRPALAAGTMVVCDRFVDSSLAYQGVGRALGEDAVRSINDFATGGLAPDLTVLLDVAPAAGRSRRTTGVDGAPVAEDRLESEPDEFHARIRDAFLLFAQRAPQRYLVLDATGTVDDLAAAVSGAVAALPETPGRAS